MTTEHKSNLGGGTSKGEGMEESGNGIEPRQGYKQYYYNQN